MDYNAQHFTGVPRFHLTLHPLDKPIMQSWGPKNKDEQLTTPVPKEFTGAPGLIPNSPNPLGKSGEGP